MPARIAARRSISPPTTAPIAAPAPSVRTARISIRVQLMSAMYESSTTDATTPTAAAAIADISTRRVSSGANVAAARTAPPAAISAITGSDSPGFDIQSVVSRATRIAAMPPPTTVNAISRRCRLPPTRPEAIRPLSTVSRMMPVVEKPGCSRYSLNWIAPNSLSITASQNTGSEKNRNAENVDV